MPSEPLPARILMTVIDPTHPRYRQAGVIVAMPEEDEDGRVTVFVLQFNDDGGRDVFSAAQVRLVREG